MQEVQDLISFDDDYSTPLPETSDSIPVNAANERIDEYIVPPVNAQWRLYEVRISEGKLCTLFHLANGCDDRVSCNFDHDRIDSEIKYCLRYALRKVPCRKGGACRKENCFMGHTCRAISCKNGQIRRCQLTRQMHGMNVLVVKWVRSDERHGDMKEGNSVKEDLQASKQPWSVRTGVLIDI